MSDSVVVIGAGQAASQLVASLRTEGFTGAITLIGDEKHLPYQRPPLSKAYLKGELDREAGNFGFDPLNFMKGKSAEQQQTMKLKEVNNGRLAMLAFGGIATQTALGEATHGFPYF